MGRRRRGRDLLLFFAAWHPLGPRQWPPWCSQRPLPVADNGGTSGAAVYKGGHLDTLTFVLRSCRVLNFLDFFVLISLRRQMIDWTLVLKILIRGSHLISTVDVDNKNVQKYQVNLNYCISKPSPKNLVRCCIRQQLDSMILGTSMHEVATSKDEVYKIILQFLKMVKSPCSVRWWRMHLMWQLNINSNRIFCKTES